MKTDVINQENEVNNRLWLEKFQNTRLKFEGVCIEIKPTKKNRYMVAFASLRSTVNGETYEIDHVNILMTQNEIEFFHLKPFKLYQFTASVYRYKHSRKMSYPNGATSITIPVLTTAYSINELNKVEELERSETNDLSLFIKNRLNNYTDKLDVAALTKQIVQEPNNGAREYFIEQLREQREKETNLEKDTVDAYIQNDSFLNKNSDLVTY